MSWFFRAGRRASGPFSTNDMGVLLANGDISADTEVRRNDEEWLRLANVPELAALIGPVKRRADAFAIFAAWTVDFSVFITALTGGMLLTHLAVLPFGFTDFRLNLAYYVGLGLGLYLYHTAIMLTGNSAGRALAGIRPIPPDGRAHLNFADTLRTNLRIENRASTPGRSAAVLLAGVVLASGLVGGAKLFTDVALPAWHRAPVINFWVQPPPEPVEWTNADTRVTLDLPFGWTANSFDFTNEKKGLFALLYCNTAEPDLDLGQLGELAMAYLPKIRWGNTRYADETTWLAMGEDEGLPISLRVKRSDTGYCFVLYRRLSLTPGMDISDIDDPALTKILFSSVRLAAP